jgi:hypothetical protein
MINTTTPELELTAEQIGKASRHLSATLDAPLLRGRVWPHPLFGLWDGYQWLLATAAHTERHIQQIREAKADHNFPTSH